MRGNDHFCGADAYKKSAEFIKNGQCELTKLF